MSSIFITCLLASVLILQEKLHFDQVLMLAFNFSNRNYSDFETESVKFQQLNRIEV